jgi:hypothetical protein
VCLLTAAACGWWAWRSWTAQRQSDVLARTGRAEAVAVGPGSVSAESGRTRVTWSVVVSNPGLNSIRVRAPVPGEVGAQDIGFLQARPRSLVIAPGAYKDIVVETVVPCADATPLRAPELLVRGTDGREHAAPVTGALAVVVAACEEQPPGGRALALAGTTRADDVLTLQLTSPTGRRWNVVGVLADGALLSSSAVTVGAEPADVVLSAPHGAATACPTTWRTSGVPLAVEVLAHSAPTAGTQPAGPDQLVRSEPVRIPVQVGLTLTTWLLDVACARGEAGR